MLKAFDAPSREECAAQRPRSNTPLAALTLLNDPTFVEAARVFAARVVDNGGESFDQRLEFAFRSAVSRPPDEYERGLLLKLHEERRRETASDLAGARALTVSGQAPPAKELDPAEHAAWTAVARAILNMSETNTRN
jgi:hypothetical protein